jgi:hypothetical protein
MTLRPWTRGPFELIVHAELHFRSGNDFDRRVALITFDNAIEVAIANYVSLNPMLRGNRTYTREEAEQCSRDFHTKMQFLRAECVRRGATESHPIEDLVWYHQQRNQQYHEGTYSAPNLDVLSSLRDAALWVFGLLYDISDVTVELEEQILAHEKARGPEEVEPNANYDTEIDDYYEPVQIGELTYNASEVLFRTDPEAYRERAIELLATEPSRLRIVS